MVVWVVQVVMFVVVQKVMFVFVKMGVDFVVQGEECWLLVQVVVERQEHVPEVELVWGIEGQTILSPMRERSMVEMKV